MSNKLFFLGSGFSKAINPRYPTLKELTEITIKNFSERNKNNSVEKRFHEIPDIVKSDIEQLLSYLYTNHPWKTSIEKSLDLALFKSLTVEIADCLKIIKTKWMTEDTAPFFQVLKDLQIPLITLNYDTLIEEFNKYSEIEYNCHFKYDNILIYIETPNNLDKKTTYKNPYLIIEGEYKHRSGGRREIQTENINLKNRTLVIDGCFLQKMDFHDFKEFFKQNLPDVNTDYDDFNTFYNTIERSFKTDNFSKLYNDLNIIKLHGSIDINCVEKSDGTIEVLDGWESMSQAYNKITSPYIIPPILDKNMFYNDRRINLEWTNAHEVIKNADEIYIIGFSFPETDTSIRFLFQSALSKSQCKIYFVNIAPEETLQKNYDKVFNSTNHSPSYELNFDYCGKDKAFPLFCQEILNNELLSVVKS